MLPALNYLLQICFIALLLTPTFLARNLANLYVSACVLFPTGWIGFFFFFWYIFIFALSVGDVGYIWVRYLTCLIDFCN